MRNDINGLSDGYIMRWSFCLGSRATEGVNFQYHWDSECRLEKSI